MKETEVIAFEAVIPNNGTPIGFAGGEGEAGYSELQHRKKSQQIIQIDIEPCASKFAG